ncbi:gluconate 2-dehydrogenase [Vibrio galatheae]|uniref:Gluconate 2-dehydrogenase n=1 Tax=Vibrio galatheae TaxID=579748 RepID=A0A0F4NII7_9VIBR|nr:cytochrome c [Vibrio galatheae]KJY81891.1 gluconate 2-dehydrogenase [Vibrio galatheae]
MKKLAPLALLMAISPMTMAEADNELIKKGKYLSELSDCYACHTAEGGEPYAGGLAFKTPFGTIYSTNITSDKQQGIGGYSFEEFDKAMRHGVAPKGNLYPAMPYTSFDKITQEDMRALYAYFMDTKPSSQPNSENDVMFPANIRTGLKAWNLLNHSPQEFVADSSKSDDWNRGNYILNSFGHCGECHTPRDMTMAMDHGQHYQGAMIGNVWAPDITPEALIEQGWSTQDVKHLLSTGYSRKGTVVGEMYTAIYHSLSKFDERDLQAAATYLLDSDEEIAGKSLAFNIDANQGEGYQLYMGYCAGCHGIEGEGKPNFAPGLAGNGSLVHDNSVNLLVATLFGIKPQHYSTLVSFDDMPAYGGKLNDAELTGLVNYLKAAFTESPVRYTEAEISALRKEVEDNQKNAAH